jgi:hypothetical protein
MKETLVNVLVYTCVGARQGGVGGHSGSSAQAHTHTHTHAHVRNIHDLKSLQKVC